MFLDQLGRVEETQTFSVSPSLRKLFLKENERKKKKLKETETEEESKKKSTSS
jgi:hypothetical protein